MRLLAAIALTLLSTGCSFTSASPVAVIHTNLGAITIELNRKQAPRSVENFIAYVQAGHYEGTQIHRVVPGFVIQGGGLRPDFTEVPTRAPIVNESDNGLPNHRGTVAMARAMDPHSAAAQFFINLTDNPQLDYQAGPPLRWGYAVFGRITAGMDIVDAIAALPTGAGGPMRGEVPQQPVLIQGITLPGDRP